MLTTRTTSITTSATHSESSGQSKPIFKSSGILQYRKALSQFLGMLFTLVHIIGGVPARGIEIGGLRYRDSLVVDRNLFILQERVVFVTQYHKGIIISNRLKVIPRVLPAAVGGLVTTYLAYVRPFIDNINLTHDGPPENDYLWPTSKGTS